MKYILFVILSVNLLSICNAQQIYFNKRLHISSINDASKIISNGNSYDLILASIGFGVGSKNVFVRIDSIGNIELQKVHGADSSNSFPSVSGFNRLKDSSYVYAGSSNAHGTDVTLYRLSKDGDSIWTRQYGDTSFQSGWMCKPTRDGGFVITGQTCTYDYYGDVLLIKTDSMGNFQWQKHYGGGGYDLGISIDTCFDGGFLIAGYTWSFGINATPNNGNWYVIKTDSLGSIKWYRAPGGLFAESAASCLQAKDGNYIVAGDTNYYDNSNRHYGKPYIMKLDTAGNTLWAKDYGPLVFNTGVTSLKELKDGSLIASGELYDSTSNNRLRGFILKTDSNGDSLWYRKYANLTGIHSDNILFDITPTDDGGFAAFGTVYPALPDTGKQDVWVLKVDSNGCEISNCLISGLIPSLSYKEDINIFPNPSNGLFHINTSDEIEKTEVYNYIGETIFYKTGRTEQINLSNAAGGIYFYSVTIKGGKAFTGKIVKE